jgi:hypothetical protein
MDKNLGLTLEAIRVLMACYSMPVKASFGFYIWCAEQGDSMGLRQAELPILKNAANWSKSHKLSFSAVCELLDIPGLIYEGKKVALRESVLLPCSSKKSGNLEMIQLDSRQQSCLHIRDLYYKGSWNKMADDIIAGNTGKDTDLSIIKNLQAYENKHLVNLGSILRAFVPLEPDHEENQIKR